MRRPTFRRVAVAVAVLLSAVAASRSVGSGSGPLSSFGTQTKLRLVVDGAASPARVPDDVAYSLFFRMLDQRADSLEEHPRPADAPNRGPLRAYINTIFNTMESQSGVPRPHGPNSAPTNERVTIQRQRADRLIAWLREHESRIDLVESSSRTRGPERYAPQRAALVQELRSSLLAHLGAQDAALLERFVSEVVKTRVRGYERH